MKKSLKVLLLFNAPYFTARDYDFKEEFSQPDNMYTENDVYQALKVNGHEVRLLGLYDRLDTLFEEVRESQPDVIFNMVDMFHEKTHLDKNVAGVLEMLGIPYTGASPASLMICNDKALSKKILTYHRIKVPNFYTFYRNYKVWLPKTLKLPAVVKPLSEEASRGISLASIVDSENAFIERIKFIHNNMNMDAIAEEYVEGRELYISIIGNKKIMLLPPREIKFGQLPEGEPRIATYKAKWDDEYRDRWGIKSVFAGKLAEGLDQKLADICKRAYRALNLNGYARFDIRVTPEGAIYIIEPNANPCIARCDELAQAAEKEGLSYEALINKVIALALE